MPVTEEVAGLVTGHVADGLADEADPVAVRSQVGVGRHGPWHRGPSPRTQQWRGVVLPPRVMALTCTPPGGSHPMPQQACAALQAYLASGTPADQRSATDCPPPGRPEGTGATAHRRRHPRRLSGGPRGGPRRLRCSLGCPARGDRTTPRRLRARTWGLDCATPSGAGSPDHVCHTRNLGRGPVRFTREVSCIGLTPMIPTEVTALHDDHLRRRQRPLRQGRPLGAA